MTMNDVIWKPIEGYEGSYEVSNDGRVRGLDRIVKRSTSPRFVRGVEIKPNYTNSGYKIARLRKDGVSRPFYIHRLVAAAFVANPNGYNIVNHKDENKLNNNADNLEWCTFGYNLQYADGQKKRNRSKRKRVVVESSDGSKLFFDSISDASAFLNCDPSNVSHCCNRINNTRHVYGYLVSFASDCDGGDE